MDELRDFIEHLYLNRAPNLPASGFADILDSLIWCLANGDSKILAIQRDWLESDDIDKVKIALSMNEIFPFNNLTEMTSCLRHICEKFPNLKNQCENMAALWTSASSEMKVKMQ
jgi:hypothetical protein